MSYTPPQKIENILDALKLRSKINPVDLYYPQFPDKKRKAGVAYGKWIEIMKEIKSENSFLSRLDKCVYTVTSDSEEERKAFQKCKDDYYEIINEIHELVTRR
ncbi:hypothetical protein EO244_00565 [Ancylomarina salipaludis]|uniref:Uncharacterized protein n=1 Tax=Ancylomarina salipaludis TaxID=2501299 RepID=A0A4Q1JPU4_9BACT|nr:hypothetical protein [Ancylomarina salipaludis]RXQ97414.1 hypothetical protein EO244_00565 [Ancylomarina salipaludis]